MLSIALAFFVACTPTGGFPFKLLLSHPFPSLSTQARTQGGGGGGSPLPMNPPRSFKFRFKINGKCRMRAHCVRARFRDRSRPCVSCMRMRRSCNFQASDRCTTERARPCSSGPGELLTALSRRGSVRVISVQNGEHSFCSKRRYDERKSFNGHSFLPANEERRVQSQPFCWSLGIRGRNQWKEPCFQDWSTSC